MICRLTPWPEPVTRAFRLANEKIYNQMQGKSEFEVTGNLKDWERWDRLHEIRVKTLTMGATYDEMDPADMVKMAKMMRNATSAICPNGSHLALWDDQAVYFQHLLDFFGPFEKASQQNNDARVWRPAVSRTGVRATTGWSGAQSPAGLGFRGSNLATWILRARPSLASSQMPQKLGSISYHSARGARRPGARGGCCASLRRRSAAPPTSCCASRRGSQSGGCPTCAWPSSPATWRAGRA